MIPTGRRPASTTTRCVVQCSVISWAARCRVSLGPMVSTTVPPSRLRSARRGRGRSRPRRDRGRRRSPRATRRPQGRQSQRCSAHDGSPSAPRRTRATHLGRRPGHRGASQPKPGCRPTVAHRCPSSSSTSGWFILGSFLVGSLIGASRVATHATSASDRSRRAENYGSVERPVGKPQHTPAGRGCDRRDP